ncbi:MAG: hypothetical protein KDD69_07860 [Bdellovibrionales bacterium]|nr:hypothetical protein [Bdellovibrionales bacterium]
MSQIVHYWRGSAEVRGDLIAGLAAKEFDVRQFRGLEELLDVFDQEPPVLLVVDASAGEREASQRVIELANTPKLYPVPILFVALQAEKRTDALEGSYVGVVPVSVPYRLDAVIAGAQYLIAHPDAAEEAIAAIASFRGGLSESDSVNDADQAVLSSTVSMIDSADVSPAQDPPTPLSAIAPPHGRKRHLLPENTESIRRRMAEFPDPANLSGSNGGVAFALARDPADFYDAHLLPELVGDASIVSMLEALGRDDLWLATHAKRVAFVSSAISNALSFGSARDRSLRIAGLFLNWALRDRPLNLIRHDFVLNPSSTISEIIGESYLQSAAFVEERCGDKRAAEVIRTVSVMLRTDSLDVPRDLQQDAQALLGVELSSRSCWGLGFWDPYGVYRAIRYFRAPDSIIQDEMVKHALAKVLGEAVTIHVTVGNYFVSHLDDTEPEVAVYRRNSEADSERSVALVTARLAREGRKKRSIPIAELAPGMLLAGPVIALDGRIILNANVVLSEDIVLDLWQLAAIRALQGKVEVAVEES